MDWKLAKYMALELWFGMERNDRYGRMNEMY